MRSNGLFEETNKQRIFFKLFCNLNISLREIYGNNKKKGENTMISHVQ